jgi:hypothetical protein
LNIKYYFWGKIFNMGYSPYRSERGYTTEIIFRKPQWNRIRYTDVGRLEYLVRFFQIFLLTLDAGTGKLNFKIWQ